jgi:hypothetical protein
MKEWMIELIWSGVGVAFFFAMLTHLRLWSVARDVHRIAEALEGMSLRNHGHNDEMNGVREYLE